MMPVSPIGCERALIGRNSQTCPARLVPQCAASTTRVGQDLRHAVILTPRTSANFEYHAGLSCLLRRLVPELHRPVGVAEIKRSFRWAGEANLLPQVPLPTC